MAMSDATLAFVPANSSFSMVAAAGVNIPSPGVIDLLGQGVGQAPANIIGTSSATFATDMGVGNLKDPEIQIIVGMTLQTSTSATLNVAFQGAPDTGAAGGYLPGTWETFSETGPIPQTQLHTQRVIRMDWPVAFPFGSQPRFVRLLFQVASGTSFTAGTISSALPLTTRDDYSAKYAQSNYVVA